MARQDGGSFFDSAWNRHMIQVCIICVGVGSVWGVSQADINSIEKDQDKTARAVEAIQSAVTEVKIEAARAKQAQQNIEARIEEINKKLDTLIWRTSPYNPKNQ